MSGHSQAYGCSAGENEFRVSTIVVYRCSLIPMTYVTLTATSPLRPETGPPFS